jgi:pantetheine-phosphate adenylyltransferase
MRNRAKFRQQRRYLKAKELFRRLSIEADKLNTRMRAEKQIKIVRVESFQLNFCIAASGAFGRKADIPECNAAFSQPANSIFVSEIGRSSDELSHDPPKAVSGVGVVFRTLQRHNTRQRAQNQYTSMSGRNRTEPGTSHRTILLQVARESLALPEPRQESIVFDEIRSRRTVFRRYSFTTVKILLEIPYMSVSALYPGTFDPPTNGHIDIILRGSRLFDHLTVAILRNRAKDPLFTVPERVEMLEEVTQSLDNVSVATFDGLTVDFARQQRASAVLRGIRAISDYEYEFQMALMNRQLAPEIETVFLQPAGRYSFVSSRMVKEVFSLGGDVANLLPPNVLKRLRERIGKI